MDLKNIGIHIKRLRLECGLTQEELAIRSELTKGFISQLENNVTSPSIQTLDDILEVLGTSLGEFFNENDDEVYCYEEKDFYVSHNEEGNYTIKWIVPNAQKYEMEPIIIEIEPGGKSMEDAPHSGEEFGYVLEGEVVLQVGKKKYTLRKGNSFYYLANKFHGLYNKTDQNVTVLWVSTPPMF